MRRLRWLAVALLVAGCGPDLTEVLVLVDTDLPVPAELDEIRVDVIGPDGVARRSEGRLASVDDLPRTLGLVHRGGDLGPVSLTVTGLVSGRNVVQRRARFDFVPGETRVLRITLFGRCAMTRCVGDETCAANGCRPIAVQPDELETYDPSQVGRLDGSVGEDAAIDGGADACSPAPEACNDRDDDCDGDVDEDFDLSVDMANCGVCANACPSDPANAASECVAGECQLACDDGFLDCDSGADGCEASALAATTCGGCDSPCPPATPLCAAMMTGNACTDRCTMGFDECMGSCVDLRSDPLHCSACGTPCPMRANATAVCSAGACGFECDAGFFDCDGDTSNGCESRQREVGNCGGCGTTCSRTNGIVSCATGSCELIGCASDHGNCDTDDGNGCEESLASNLMSCGMCGNACPVDPLNASVACVMGVCAVTCDPGFGDCDAMPGCEASLSDPMTCGACAVSCDSSAPACSPSGGGGYSCTAMCMGGVTCGMSCVDTESDPSHCGMCGFTCPTGPQSTTSCVAGACQLGCDPGFGDCNSDPMDGCEIDLESTEAHCGMCAMVCPGGAEADCAGGVCGLVCAANRDDCDADPSNGCETDVTTSQSHCGGCMMACPLGPGATGVQCTASTCVITGCAGSLEDCDASAANGCEVDTDTSRQNCGMCGNQCPPGERCCSGMCRTAGGGCP